MTKRITATLLFTLLLVAPAWSQYELKNAFPGLVLQDAADLQSVGESFYAPELAGRVVTFTKDDPSRKVIMNIDQRISHGSDGGLFSIALHPDFESNNTFFLNYMAADPLRKVVARYRMDADPIEDSEEIVLEIPIDIGGHNGGTLAFGPDGYLYIATGDGNCCAGDPMGHAQNTETLPGTMLRIDVDNPSEGRAYGIPADNPFVGKPGFREEIYAYGFRNPWRFSFDRETGDLWLGDVGDLTREEVNLVEPGKNYGWNILEGTHCFSPDADCASPDLVEPVWDYPRDEGRCVIGGYVYRGSEIPSLAGKYVFGDWTTGRIWALTPGGEAEELLKSEYHYVSFGEDEDGEIFVVTIEDSIYQVVQTESLATEQPDRLDPLLEAYPVPFKNEVTIEYTLHAAEHVTLDIVDALGRKVRTIDEGVQSAGRHSIQWDGRAGDGRRAASGVYYYRLTIDEDAVSGPLIRAR